MLGISKMPARTQSRNDTGITAMTEYLTRLSTSMRLQNRSMQLLSSAESDVATVLKLAVLQRSRPSYGHLPAH